MVDLGYSKNQIISIAECSAQRPSMISQLFDYTPQLVNITAILRILYNWLYYIIDCLLEASGFLGRQQQLLAEAQYSGKFKWNLSGFWRILYSSNSKQIWEFIIKKFPSTPQDLSSSLSSATPKLCRLFLAFIKANNLFF